MPKTTILFLLLGFFSLEIQAQLYYEKEDSIVVSENNRQLLYPFQGGFNAPQFQEIDLDYDGQLDLLIYDRSGSRVSTYLNKGTVGQINYIYAPQYQEVFPEIPSWVICRDYNCDGQMDLFTGIRGASISVYENTGDANNGLAFSFVGKVRSFYYNDPFDLQINPGAANLPGIIDMNNDGDIDFVFYNQGGTQLELHKNVSVDSTGNCGLLFYQRSQCWGDLTESGRDSRIFLDSCRFGNPIPNAESTGGDIDPLDPKEELEQKRSSKHAGSSVSLIDLDNSGSIDVVLGKIGSTNLTALYNVDSIPPFIDSHFGSMDTAFPSYNVPVSLDVFPAAHFVDVNNDNKKDMIVSINNNDFATRAKFYQNILYYENTGTNGTNFEYRKNDLFQDNVIDLGRGAFPTFVDYNNDGLQDLIVSNDGYFDSTQSTLVSSLALFENKGTINYPEYELIDRDFGNISTINLDINNNIPQRQLIPASGDLDGDGDLDLILGDHNGKIHYFKDVSAPNAPADYQLEKAAFQFVDVFFDAAPALIDVDQDSLLDLVIGRNTGMLDFHKNLGSASEPIFNLEVQSITWQYDSIMRFQLRGNPDLSYFEVGQIVDPANALFGDNDVPMAIGAINNTAKYLDLIHPFRRSNIDDEVNSTAVIDYSIKNWGNVDITQYHSGNQDSRPFLYRDSSNSLKLVIGSWNGYLYFYEDIDSNIFSGDFRLVDTSYAKRDFGTSLGIGGADINNDGMIDLAVGNEAGGLEILFATGFYPRDSLGIPIDTTVNAIDTSGSDTTIIDTSISVIELKALDNLIHLYPNPTENSFFIEVPLEIKDFELRVIDLNGRMVINRRFVDQAKVRIDHNLRSGIYIVEIKSSERRLTAKLIVNPD